MSVLLVCVHGMNGYTGCPFHVFVVISDILFLQMRVLKISVMWSGGYTDVCVFSNSIGHVSHPRTCLALICCLTSTCWHTHSGKHVWLKNFARNENFWIFALENIHMSQSMTHLLQAVIDGHGSGFSEQDVHVSLFRLCSKNPFVRHGVWCQCCWHVCSGTNRYTAYSLSLVCCHQWHSVWTNAWLKISVTCLGGYTNVCVFSNWWHQTSTCMCSTNLLS